MSENCLECSKAFRSNSRGIQCDICHSWFHLKCTLLSLKEYKYFSTTEDLWICLHCRRDIFPFHSLVNHELINLLSFNSNTECLCSNKIMTSRLEFLPSLELSASINNNPNLQSFDIDLQLPSTTNFRYYSSHEFHSNNDIQSSLSDKTFSALHFNIRSVARNFEQFLILLNDMNHNFSVIGLTETKIKLGMDPYMNTSLPGYNFISQPTLSNAGGVGFFIKDNYSYAIRDDLSITKPEFESLWVEFDIPHQHNIVCGVFYRHPESKLDIPKDFLLKAAQKISLEGKFCFLMGDFNIDLLKHNSHSETEDFLNSLGSYAFHPQILKPTRITDHSTTLIDNIFFNSLEHHVISGNIISGITDHLPNFLIVNKLSNLLKRFKLFKRDYSKLNNRALVAELQNTDWSEVLKEDHEQSVTLIFQNFYDHISKLINNHVPIRSFTRKEIKSLSKPWVTQGIKKSIREKKSSTKNS